MSGELRNFVECKHGWIGSCPICAEIAVLKGQIDDLFEQVAYLTRNMPRSTSDTNESRENNLAS